MSEEDKKVDPNLEEVVDQTTETNEDKTSETLFYQKKAAQEKAAKLEVEKAALQAQLDDAKAKSITKPTDNIDTSTREFALQDKLEAIEFTIAHKELSPEAIKSAMSIAKSDGISNEEALKNPMVEAYISKLKEDESTKNAIPTGNRSAVSTDEEKTESEGLLNRARETGNIDDWAKVVAKRRINK